MIATAIITYTCELMNTYESMRTAQAIDRIKRHWDSKETDVAEDERHETAKENRTEPEIVRFAEQQR